MKLYYSPGACSLSPHIILCELDIPHQLERVNLKTHTTAYGGDYYHINPKGYVPALELEDGQVLTEGPAILQYLADRKPESGLNAPAGTLDRARVQEWLAFIGTEIHKTFSPLFRPDITPDWKAAQRAQIDKRLSYVDTALAGHDYLTGRRFRLPDAYLFTIVRWTGPMDIDLAPWPNLQAYQARVAARPAVAEALRAEGLVK